MSDSLKMVKNSKGVYELEIKSYDSLDRKPTTLVSTNTVALNADLEFIFGFSLTGGVGKLDTIYEIYKKQDEGHFIFTDDQTKITAEFKGSKYTPSAVPVPSSALLLGSSILGLAGFGSRRKKAQAV